MSVNLGLLVAAGILGAAGAYLLMERSLVRMLLGLILAGNGINMLIIVITGGMGNPPIKGQTAADRSQDADPLAQAMVLTAIVLTMGVAAFVLALVYRLFVLNRDDDDVEDDTEDVKILTSSIHTAPDRDRSDDPITGADTAAGDYFDDDGNPLTAEEFVARKVIETDLMPEEVADIVDELCLDDTTESESAGEARE
ncbi:Na(+)/H(+) antiporter subunit C [Gordonia effusa NBRC 100432]|uniref:Na(+)/H(+) antiporter subunit C n=1 Tax=Gordonia effusa NBRC 100432 TaxID=1077974 RepID=H0QXN4_9ACTN|nr:Na(+)/H(+) antiporter subunit C [Gordonia effusa]GAB17585.1 Na(+)/H(+) antiporter subunit C [Gordonia effusa NBRC 100432]